jgi:hypothetical protein
MQDIAGCCVLCYILTMQEGSLLTERGDRGTGISDVQSRSTFFYFL